MSDPLIDPNKPPHAIVEEFDDGDAMRNDGVRLGAANKNPWYVLATVFGEQAADATWWDFDEELAAKNRRAWNGWFCGGLDEAARADRAEKTGLDVDDLAPLTETELTEIRNLFAARMQAAGIENPELPDPAENILFSKVHVLNFLNFKQFVFEKSFDFSKSHCSGYADFCSAAFTGSANFILTTFTGNAVFESATFTGNAPFFSAMFTGDANFVSTTFTGNATFFSAMFTGDAIFESAAFTGDAVFESAMFTGNANFVSTTFSGNAVFEFTTFAGNANFVFTIFTGYADFESVTFTGYASFVSTTFTEYADFKSTTFEQQAKFSSAKFKSTTDFKNAKFITHVPEFYAAELYEDTDFTLPEDYLKNWPPLTGEGVMEAARQKKAYNRLRLYMNKSLQIDEEQFFHRMEMRCKRETEGWRYRWIYSVFGALSDYGNSVLRPLIALVVLIAIGAPVMLGYLAWDNPANGAWFWEALGWSISNSLPFLGFGKVYYGGYALGLPAWLKVLGGLQTIGGFVLLFFLGLGLRNRFRLR